MSNPSGTRIPCSRTRTAMMAMWWMVCHEFALQVARDGDGCCSHGGKLSHAQRASDRGGVDMLQALAQLRQLPADLAWVDLQGGLAVPGVVIHDTGIESPKQAAQMIRAVAQMGTDHGIHGRVGPAHEVDQSLAAPAGVETAGDRGRESGGIGHRGSVHQSFPCNRCILPERAIASKGRNSGLVCRWEDPAGLGCTIWRHHRE